MTSSLQNFQTIDSLPKQFISFDLIFQITIEWWKLVLLNHSCFLLCVEFLRALHTWPNIVSSGSKWSTFLFFTCYAYADDALMFCKSSTAQHSLECAHSFWIKWVHGMLTTFYNLDLKRLSITYPRIANYQALF